MSDLAYHDPNVKVRNIVIPKRGVPEKTAQIPEVHQKNVKKKNGKSRGKKRLERVFFFIIAFLVLILAVELIFHFIISPKLVINKITIEVAGALELSNKEILALAGIGEEEFFFRLDEKIIEERLTQFPLIKTASVEKNFPDTVRIIITGRTPLAMSLVNTEEGMVPVVFDQEGVVFQVGKSVENFDNLVISGIRFHDIKLGMQLPEEIGGLLKDLTALKKDSPFLYEMLSEIRIINRGGGVYEALLFTERHSVPVRIGMSVDERQLKYMFMILDILREDAFAEKIEELDLRSGEIVYRTKEAGDVE